MSPLLVKFRVVTRIHSSGWFSVSGGVSTLCDNTELFLLNRPVYDRPLPEALMRDFGSNVPQHKKKKHYIINLTALVTNTSFSVRDDDDKSPWPIESHLKTKACVG